MDNKYLENVATKGAAALGGIVVDGISGLIKGGMEERDMEDSKLEALGTVTEVCKDMVPDMAAKAASGVVSKFFITKEKEKINE